MEKELLKKLGEETMYSAKNHFKASDLRRSLVTATMWSCAALSVIGAMGLADGLIGQVISALALFCTVALLIWNQGEGQYYAAEHMRIGEQYLSLHKRVRECYLLQNYDEAVIKELCEAVSNLDNSRKPAVPAIANQWARRAIKKIGETDNWFENE